MTDDQFRLAEAEKSYKQAEAVARYLESRLADLKTEIVMNGRKADNIVHGDWDCPDSKTRMCYYDIDDDPRCDICLVCGHPA